MVMRPADVPLKFDMPPLARLQSSAVTIERSPRTPSVVQEANGRMAYCGDFHTTIPARTTTLTSSDLAFLPALLFL
ncbi:hypothetical protein E4U21_004156 [Claviceps maximensis]|nr:hypothetical protein E4U21_004156 [Claviceps maximensis]